MKCILVGVFEALGLGYIMSKWGSVDSVQVAFVYILAKFAGKRDCRSLWRTHFPY